MLRRNLAILVLAAMVAVIFVAGGKQEPRFSTELCDPFQQRCNLVSTLEAYNVHLVALGPVCEYDFRIPAQRCYGEGGYTRIGDERGTPTVTSLIEYVVMAECPSYQDGVEAMKLAKDFPSKGPYIPTRGLA
jgi:hypothetical protein